MDFWFGPGPLGAETAARQKKLWWGAAAATDRAIGERFATTVGRVAGGESRRWAAAGPRARLAAVIALDQFSRAMFRGGRGAFENDARALALARDAIERGEDRGLHVLERWFLQMPFEHSENLADQERSVALFEGLAADAPADLAKEIGGALDFARRHADVIRRFGRFPHRNAALRRISTPEEAEFLKQPGSRF